MGNLKGTGFQTTCEYLVSIGGPDAVERVKAALTPEDRAVFAKRILPISWLDYGAFIRFMIAADKVLGKGDLQIVRDASIYGARKDLRGIYKMFISLVSPKTILASVPLVWRQYYDTGKLFAVDLTDHSGRWKLVDFPGMPLHHEVDMIPFCEEGMRLSGAKNIRFTHPLCIARGDDHCEFLATWE